MADYNIEFSHIYADEYFGEEQLNSIEILKKVINRLNSENKTFVTTILIDEFNAVTSKLNVEKLIETIKSYGVPVNFVAFESKFKSISDKIIKEIPSCKLKLEYFNNPQKEVLFLKEEPEKVSLKVEYNFSYRHTCAMLSAAWALCRLGAYSAPKSAVKKGNVYDEFVAKKIITILPKKYAPVEAKVGRIIGATKFRNCLKEIEYEYY